jgi:hypothetical protein
MSKATGKEMTFLKYPLSLELNALVPAEATAFTQ